VLAVLFLFMAAMCVVSRASPNEHCCWCPGPPGHVQKQQSNKAKTNNVTRSRQPQAVLDANSKHGSRQHTLYTQRNTAHVSDKHKDSTLYTLLSAQPKAPCISIGLLFQRHIWYIQSSSALLPVTRKQSTASKRVPPLHSTVQGSQAERQCNLEQPWKE
jgi:hypothetical protein